MKAAKITNYDIAFHWLDFSLPLHNNRFLWALCFIAFSSFSIAQQANIDVEDFEEAQRQYFAYANAQVELIDQFETKKYQSRYHRVKVKLDKLVANAKKKQSIAKLDSRLSKIIRELDKLERQILVELLIVPNRAKHKQLNKRLIPNQYTVVAQAIEVLEQLLLNTPKDVPKIAKAKYAMEFELKRANNYQNEVTRLKAASGAEFEKIVKSYHRQLTQIAKAQGLNAVEDLAFVERVQKLLTSQ